MITREEWRWALTRSLLVIAAAALPYWVAYLATPDGLFYTGFLSNPEDGNAYLAKMRQGMRGEWLYHLPYTPERHQGEFLFTYYVALGRLSRWTGLAPIWIFHLARAFNGLLLLLVVYYAAALFFPDRAQRRFAFVLTALGSGLGWLITLLDGLTADLWIPEGYIFYSLFVNPHFPLAIALTLLLVLGSVTPWGAPRPGAWRLAGLALAAAILGIVQPFCLFSVGGLLLVYALILWIEKRRFPWREVVSGAVIGAAGLPFVVNAYLVSTRNPSFAAWSAQNQTLSPPPWDYIAGYGVVLLLALVGMRLAIRRRKDSDWLLLAWVGSTAIALYIPFSLQRRLVMGLIVPLGMLAAAGWFALPRGLRLRPALVLAFAALTHLFLIALTLVGAFGGSDLLFMSQDEHQAIDWLAAHAGADALVVASPRTGLYIPAWSGQRVYYGHRFDTARAQERQAQLEAFFSSGDLSLLVDCPDPGLPSCLRPDYVFFGPRERSLVQDRWQPPPAWSPVYQQGSVAIYALPEE